MVVPIDTLTDNEYDHFWARPNEAELGKAVAWLLDHKKRAREIGANGPKHVRDNFQWRNAARQFAALFREATGTQVPVNGA
jgi:glycosyltransferase involved in cell wall biosynthesis